jgi:hypothetical protein
MDDPQFQAFMARSICTFTALRADPLRIELSLQRPQTSKFGFEVVASLH